MTQIQNNPYNSEEFHRELDALARILLPEIQRFYESEEGQNAFDKWKKSHPDKQGR